MMGAGIFSKPAKAEVYVWQIDIAVEGTQIYAYRRLLSPDEIQRADRFYFEKDRIRFITTRYAMRKILSDCLNVAPEELVFTYSAKGKPALAPGFNESGIRFNVSHSRDIALLAVAQGLCVGVDIEFINHELATDEIAANFFSTGEIDTFRSLSPGGKVAAFFDCWTRKEAYVKALGEGLSVPLGSFDVAFGPGIPAALLRVERSPEQLSRWSMYDVTAPPGYAAALVVEGREHQLRQGQWEQQL